jgi:hypothetical protein
VIFGVQVNVSQGTREKFPPSYHLFANLYPLTKAPSEGDISGDIRCDFRVRASRIGSSSSHAETGTAVGVAKERELSRRRESKSRISFLHFALHWRGR